MIVKHGAQFILYSKDGTKKLGGPYKSKAQALKREQQINYFKNRG